MDDRGSRRTLPRGGLRPRELRGPAIRPRPGEGWRGLAPADRSARALERPDGPGRPRRAAGPRRLARSPGGAADAPPGPRSGLHRPGCPRTLPRSRRLSGQLRLGLGPLRPGRDPRGEIHRPWPARAGPLRRRVLPGESRLGDRDRRDPLRGPSGAGSAGRAAGSSPGWARGGGGLASRDILGRP